MNKKNLYIAIAIVVACVLLGFLAYSAITYRTPQKSYESTAYGISFSYPETYTLQESDISEGAKHHEISLIDTKALASAPSESEGPTAMTFDIYPANGKDTETWIEQTQASNFNLSVDKQMHDATVDGTPAVAYTWDGLYRGNSFVFAHKGNIVMASVTYMTTDDQILKDFTGVLKSVQLQ
ncbi:MAG TPA: hypothetical protein VHD38_01700 [Candidatus Paceibacterota bacterium]|nr:hypothetical protein [Candidatus Paceibacterota bacterium]